MIIDPILGGMSGMGASGRSDSHEEKQPHKPEDFQQPQMGVEPIGFGLFVLLLVVLIVTCIFKVIFALKEKWMIRREEKEIERELQFLKDKGMSKRIAKLIREQRGMHK